MRRATIVGMAVVGLGFLALGFAAQPAAPARDAVKKGLHVGTFDSRAVAVAYVHSERFKNHLKRLKADQERAKTAGNQARVTELEAQGRAMQGQLHQQGFGTASVGNILTQIQDKLPAIAQEAGVDVLVSKWDLAYCDPAAKTVDVTESIIKPFQPDRQTLATIHELQKEPPVPMEQLRKLKPDE